ncbi:MAG TPA: hypothetical protein VLL76_01355 [Candidatus Omnitrophota bacterium]|nr:hypothetical protein [Candidatus Omnitrophota bacterium]
MTKHALVGAACALLAACGPNHPAPGEAPGWNTPSPPRGSMDIPIPFRDQYLPPSAHQIEQLPPVPKGENVPYAVRGQSVAQPAAAPAAQPDCHPVPTVTVDGKPSSTVCRNPEGGWSYVPD